jgi:hypothetical protein
MKLLFFALFPFFLAAQQIDTLGLTSIGASAGGISAGEGRAFLFTATSSGTLQKAVLYQNSAGGPYKAIVAVYLDDGDASPQSDGDDILIAYSVEGTTSSVEWVEMTFSSGEIISGNSYFLIGIVNTGETTWGMRFNATATQWNGAIAYAPPPSDLSGAAFGTTFTRQGSIYVTYETPATGQNKQRKIKKKFKNFIEN